MTALLLILAGLVTVAYGATDNHAIAMLGGFLAVLFGLGLHELPLWRTVRQVEPPAPSDDEPPCPVIELHVGDATFDFHHLDDRQQAA